MDRKLQFLESFHATGSDGATYKVCGYEHLVRVESMTDGLEHWEPTGEVELRLVDGERVTMRRDGSMRIDTSGIELRRTAEEKTSA